MQNLVPHFILEKYALGESGGRFQAASLFADISGFSAATHALMAHGSQAAEAMAGIMTSIFGPLVEAVHAQGGFIATFAGDAFTALFPAEGEDLGSLRALAAAVAIQRYMIAHPVQSTTYGSFPFAIKLGLGEGEVEWGILQPERKGTGPAAQNATYYFNGPAVDSAAAAEHHAQSGTLVLSPGISTQVESAVKTLPLTEGYRRCLKVQGELPAERPCPQPAALPEVEADFVPEAVRQRENGGDFRQVISVFIQLQGIETRQDLDIFMQAVFDLLYQFDGYLTRLDFGDKGCNLLLFWGTPTSHEDDVSRALEFALELGNHTPGSFRAGLTYCPMYAGLAGSEARGEYTCYGDGINLAARLMLAAPWGSLWLDERLAGRARAHFVLEFVDELVLKGFSEKQPVHALIERRPPGENFFEGRLVGREQELAELGAFVQPIFAAGGRRFAGLLALVGEAGLGKSRLVYEFLADECGPVEGKAQVFTCQTDQVLRKPLNPFQYWLLRYFDQSATQSVERNKRAFSRKIDQLLAAVSDPALAQELNRTRSCLGALVGLEWDSSLYARLDPQGRYESTLQGLKTLIKAESLRQPVVLVLEDAQWLDSDSQGFIQLLEREIEACPLAVLATARPEREGTLFGAGIAYRQVELPGFSANELATLAADRLGGPAAPELLGLLAERAGHNPFFAEQILLYLDEQGRLAQRDGQWGLAAGRAGTLLPEQVREIFIARLDSLAREIQQIVQAAAVLGREFEVAILAQMLSAGQEAELGQWVAQAEQERIWMALSQVRYLFKHALLCDAAYEMQLQARRRSLHRLAAEALEQVYAAEREARAGEIAYHYEAACLQGLEALRPRAVETLEQAGRGAAARFENRAAVDYFSRALALVEAADPPAAEAREQRLRLLLAREDVNDLLGEREAQRADLTALEALVGPRQLPAEQAELRLRQARLCVATSDFAGAAERAQAAAEAARASGELALESRAQMEWSKSLIYRGSYTEAVEHLQLAQALAEAGELREQQARSLNGLGNVSLNQGDYAAARAYYEQALGIAREMGHRRGEAGALTNLGNIFAYQGDYAASRAYTGQALALFREIGDRSGEGTALMNLGAGLSNQSGNAAGRLVNEQALAIFRETGDRDGEAGVLCNLALAFAYQGDYAAAREYADQALALSREVDNRQFEGNTLYTLGFLLAGQGEYAAAREFCEQALAIAREIGDRQLVGIVLNDLGNILFDQGDPLAARAAYEQALAICRELELAHYVAESLSGLAECALALGDPDSARTHILEMLPILESNPTLEGAENPRRALLGCARVLLALDDPRGRDILEQMHSILQQQAARLEDESARRMFLENVPENRALCALYEKLQKGEPSAA